jgi:hypothetical protein
MWTRLLAEQSEVAKRMSANSRWNEWQGGFRFDAQFCKAANLQAASWRSNLSGSGPRNAAGS